MIIDIITLFPEMFRGPFEESIIKRAKEKGLVKINIHNLRKWAIDKRGTVDDRPYGGGVGMLLRPEPIFKAVEELKRGAKDTSERKTKVILLDPAGSLFTQKKARQLAKLKYLILICGHYEGVDYRVHQYLAQEVVSIGDYVLTGGEIPAMVIVDAVTRLIPGVLEKEEATKFESFTKWPKDTSDLPARLPSGTAGKAGVARSASEGLSAGRQGLLGRWRKKKKSYQLLEYPQYTRPENFRGLKVPKVLLSGNHQEIAKWRLKEAIKRTKKFRPDLLPTPGVD